MRLGSLLLLLLLVATPTHADNTNRFAPLEVSLVGGKVLRGKVKLRKKKLQVGAKKVAFGKVAGIRDVFPPGEARLAELREQYRRKLERDSPQDAASWVKLGRWARKRELTAEARDAFGKAVEIDPDSEGARSGLGQLQADDGTWTDGKAVVADRLAGLAVDDLAGRLELARFAVKQHLRESGFDVLAAVLARDAFHKGALKLMRPLAARVRANTALSLPVRGLWRVNNDKTRHHQRCCSSVFALDLVCVDEEGQQSRGTGRDLEDHLSFGQPFYAAAAGRVVQVQNDFPDLPVGTLGAAAQNNGVGIDHGGEEYTWYFHAQRGSIQLKVGDQVEQGQLLGRIGNSGKSNIPHLHFAVSYRGYLSIPWACGGYALVAADGTRIPVEAACPREGWTLETRPAGVDGSDAR